MVEYQKCKHGLYRKVRYSKLTREEKNNLLDERREKYSSGRRDYKKHDVWLSRTNKDVLKKKIDEAYNKVVLKK